MIPVAVIGGGITGLTAAFRLRERGIDVTLYEAGDRTGGVIRTVREDGYLAECGPNTILETSPRIGELIRDAGLEERRLYSDPGAENRYILRRGKPVLLPASLPAFFATPLFSPGAKARLLAEPFIGRSPEDAEESLAQFVTRRIGKEFLDYAINPFVAGVYAGDPARLSVKHAFPKLHALEQRYGSLIRGQILGARERKRRGTVSKQNAKKISFDEGLQVLTDALRRKLGESVRLQTPVRRLEKAPSGWRVIEETEGKTEGKEFEAVLLALPAYRLADLEFETASGLTFSPLAEIHHPPVASVVFGFRRENVAHPLKGFGTLIPEVEGFNILGTIFSSSLFPGRAPGGHVTLTSYIGGTRAPGLATGDSEQLFGLTLEDLRRIYGIKGEPVFRRSFLHAKAIPQYDVGYGRFKELMSRAEEESPGLFLAGHCRDGISLGDSIVSGVEAAARIADFLSAGSTGKLHASAVKDGIEQ